MALPATLTNHIWPVLGNGNIGPFIASSGDLYAFGYNGLFNVLFKAESTDVESWSEVDSANHPIVSNSHMDVKQVGDVFHFMGTVSSGLVYYQKFDASVDLWQNVDGTSKNKIVFTATDNGDSDWGAITVRSNGDVIIFHPGEAPANKGQNVDSAAYSRLDIDGVTSFTDGTNGLAFSSSSAEITRNDGASWLTAGFAVGDNISVTAAEDSGNNIPFATVSSIGGPGASEMVIDPSAAVTNAVDTTAVVTLLSTWITGIAVASTGVKNERRRFGYAVMDSNDQCYFGAEKEDGADLVTRAVSSANTLQATTATHTLPAIARVQDGQIYTRSAQETVAFFGTAAGTHHKLFFDTYGDGVDTSPTLETIETITTAQNSTDDPFTCGYVSDPNDANEKNYSAYIDGPDTDLQLRSDGGGTTWGDENGGTEIVVGTIDGVSANIYTRDTRIYYAYVYDDAGTTKYNEFQIGWAAGGLVLLSSAAFPDQNYFVGPFEA